MQNLSRGSSKRPELLEALNQTGRQLSTATVMFHTAVAEHFGLSLTDWKCSDFVGRLGPLTAGQLAELSSLTTGAITGVVDRLEQAGFVRRAPDPKDRRRVMIEVVPEREQEATRFIQSVLQPMIELYDHYSDEELALILDYQTRGITMLQEAAHKVRLATEGQD